MQQPSPSVAVLIQLGTLMDEYSTEVENLFAQQLAISPNSVHTIRRYAMFLLEVRSGSSFCFLCECEESVRPCVCV